MAKVACRGQVQPGTVQSKAVEKPEKLLGSGFEDFGISEIPLFPRADDHNFERLRRGSHYAGLQ